MIVDTKAYIFQLVTDVILFLLFFSKVNNYRLGLKEKLISYGFIPVIALLIANFDFSAYVIYMLILYLMSRRKKFLDLKTINLLLFTGAALALVSLISNFILSFFAKVNTNQGWLFVLYAQVIKAILLSIGLYFLKSTVDKLFSKKEFEWLLLILQCTLLLIIYFYVELSDAIGIYYHFAFGTLIFMSAEFLILSGLFAVAYLRVKKQYENQIKQQQLDNLRTYTEQLEQSQMELRKFRHDYKNMLLSLAELAQIGDVEKVRHYLDDLQLYSNQELREITDNYQDIGNVNEIHMKSILLNKFFMFEHNHVDFRFECRRPVHSLTIKSFDMVRLLSITLDNAMEAVGHETDGMITIMIFQDTDSLNITIENTGHDQVGNLKQLRKPGVTTKEKHSGLGLSIIDDIRRKYSNVFVVYKSSPKKFTVQITINDSKEEG
ncbi:sensor histidine kinase [Lactiplantibacillus mudanjiangensis]|uniref:Sensor histidine kinase NatK-like C-terminal domain-containing protein n=1 Tax=Lactiplantibacillus mudanjiangensis TaxID=1296538 RepID=A0A660E3C1_9LACO|nr:GHKL domain-containing protein [Lactiplantibacillus mudanjiangensis]VDG25294.1 hypothetical protein [Lactobacillus sp. CBA3605] [Lactiplantibacillus mudanjiangensis]VDG27453.1 hypothetical protein [Lactobacillus sp. CBA3605] [Lactiplantibacillus mudanjiangensis]